MFKPLANVLEADPRYQTTILVGIDDRSTRWLELADHHATVAHIELNAAVPIDIRNRFDIARNAFVYSWFVYEFATLAEQQSLAIIEDALRAQLLERAKRRSQKEAIEKDGLRALLNGAMGRKVIRYDDFRLPSAYPGGPSLNKLDILVELRNELSHGKWHLFPELSLRALESCADVLNRLYPQPPAQR